MTNVVSVTDNWGVQVASEYDSRSRLARRVWQGGDLPGASLQFEYDAAGHRTNVLRFADVTSSALVEQSHYAYNPVGAITDIVHANSAGDSLAEHHYARDPAQQIVSRTINDVLAAFGYDQTSQLTNAVYQPPTQPDESYLYDANGNRIGGGYLVTTNNQIIADGQFTYGYDAEGSLVIRTNLATGAKTSYAYDHRNRLVSVVDTDVNGVVTQTVAFEYDARNRRRAKIVNGTALHFLHNQEDIWADAGETAAITSRYLLGDRIDEMLARYRSGETLLWYLTDNVGTVHQLVDAAGTVVNHTTYDTFGQVLIQSQPAAEDRFMFAGREWDPETGLLYCRARYYMASAGKFVCEDPIGFASNDYNVYAYARNNPLLHRDPFGTSIVGYAMKVVNAVSLIGNVGGVVFWCGKGETLNVPCYLSALAAVGSVSGPPWSGLAAISFMIQLALGYVVVRLMVSVDPLFR